MYHREWITSLELNLLSNLAEMSTRCLYSSFTYSGFISAWSHIEDGFYNLLPFTQEQLNRAYIMEGRYFD
jgi:hypothetical protein